MIKGKKAIFEAIQANIPINRIVVSDSAKQGPDFKTIQALAIQKKISLQVIPSQNFSDLTDEQQTQGIIAYAKDYQFGSLNDVIDNPEDNPIVVVTDHLEDPYNFGAIIRTAEVLGVKSIIFPKDRNVALTPGVIKTSSGAVYHTNLIRVTNLNQSLRTLKKAGYWIYTTDVEKGTPLTQFSPNFPMVIIVGNEKKGVAPILAKQADDFLHISQKGKIESLNVSVATGIILHTLTEKREASQ
ncbi:MAG: 23S rRNA (guanosine2251-2'-O)-methyltransferase [Candidatus Marinamargulisbacteria bacterium]|jgi:23S rRNA (guanosine2251-2'-O)-methyltransferase